MPAAIFDFDGTLSLLREGWAADMAAVGLDAFARCGLSADAAHLEAEMLALAGRPSLVQMERLAELLKLAGGKPEPADVYLEQFLRRLNARTHRVYDALHSGGDRDAWTVPGSRAVLDALRSRGYTLFLASGTERPHVERELVLLGLKDYFGDRVYAPADNFAAFHKKDAVAAIIATTGPVGLIGFGDGPSETREVKAAGGYAVGVASQPQGVGGVNEVKARILRDAGADEIVADYTTWRTRWDTDVPPQ